MESLILGGNTNVCRICFDAKSENCLKFEVESEWSQLFQYCVGLTIVKGNAPQILCNNCAGKLKDYAGFKSQCLQADMMWKQLSHSVKTEKLFSLDDVETNHDNFNQFDGLSNNSYCVTVKTEVVESSAEYSDYKSSNDNPMPSTVIASPLEIPKALKRKASKSSPVRRKVSKLTTKGSKAKKESKSKIKQEKEVSIKEELADGSKLGKRKRKPSRTPVIPMKMTPYTDEERLERRVISKTTDVRKYLESIGKADENCLREKEFLEKYYIHIPPEPGTKPSKRQIVYACRKCDKRLKSKKTLVLHAKVCFEEKDLNVILDHELRSLMRGPTLPVAKLTYCGICPFSSENSDSVNEHWKEHVAANMLNCKQCSFTGRDMAEMVGHRFKHHPTELRHWIRCPICSWCTMTVNRLEYHYRSLHLNKKGGLCIHCEKEFVDYRSWICHQITHNVDRFVCDHCGRNFMHRHDIVYHLNVVFGTKKYTCETCGKGFKRMSNLRLHIKTRHTETEPLKCDHCDRMFKNKHTLSNHMWEINQPKCFCEVCGKELYKSQLKTHMMKHTGERPFKCEVCSAGFIKKKQLKTHMRVHTKVKPYSCSSCSKAFTTAKSLRGHEKTHTGDRNVKCPYCDRTYYELKRMRYHCKTKHQIVITKDEPI